MHNFKYLKIQSFLLFSYPSAAMKLKVAEEIVTAFPGLRSKNFAKGHVRFFAYFFLNYSI